MEINSENFFDIAEALHAVCTLWHDGQWSKKYELLGRSKFLPGPTWTEAQVVAENPYYAELEEARDEQLELIMNELNRFLDRACKAGN